MNSDVLHEERTPVPETDSRQCETFSEDRGDGYDGIEDLQRMMRMIGERNIDVAKDSIELPDEAPIYKELGVTKADLAAFLTHQRAYRAEDGVWEIKIILSSLSNAVETLVPVPLSNMQFDTDLVAYVEEQVESIPKKDSLRLLIYFPVQKTSPEDEAVLGTIMRVYLKERIRKRRAEERAALRSVLGSCFWGFIFMLGCQIVRWLANFPQYPTISSTLSEGLLVLGWVALWNPYDRLLFSWWPAVKQLRLVERIAQASFVFRASPYGHFDFGRSSRSRQSPDRQTC